MNLLNKNELDKIILHTEEIFYDKTKSSELRLIILDINIAFRKLLIYLLDEELNMYNTNLVKI